MISSNIHLLTEDDLQNKLAAAFARGVARGKFEAVSATAPAAPPSCDRLQGQIDGLLAALNPDGREGLVRLLWRIHKAMEPLIGIEASTLRTEIIRRVRGLADAMAAIVGDGHAQ